MNKFDVIIIGGGPAGYNLAIAIAKSNRKVLLIEKNKLGGTCVNVGCVPTKSLLNAVKKFDAINDANKYGYDITINQINWSKVIENRNQISMTVSESIKSKINANNVTFIQGEAQVVDKNTVKVASDSYHADYLVLATGASNRRLNIENADMLRKKNILVDSTGALQLKQLPKSIIFIGGGIISLEFANIYASMGVDVTILEATKRYLPMLDDDILVEVLKTLKRKNIKVLTDVHVKSFNSNYQIAFDIQDKSYTAKADLYFESIGRVPNNQPFIESNLFKFNQRGFLEVDNNLLTNVKNVYAMGDLVALKQLTSVAYKHGHYILNHLINKTDNPAFDYNVVPANIFIDQDISFVGDNEMSLKQKNIEYKKVFLFNKNIPRAQADLNAENGGFKVLVSKNNTILGASCYTKNGSFIIDQIAVSMKNNLTIDKLINVAFSHPTYNEVIYYALREIK